MFNTQKEDDESKKPGHIQNARLFDTQETKQNIRELEEKSKPGLLQLNKEEEQRAMNKRYEKKAKSKTAFSRTSKDGTKKQADLDELIKKDKAKEEESQVRPWLRLESLNTKAKNDCSFLKDSLLEDIKAKQSNAQRW